MEWTASPGSTRTTRERPLAPPARRQERVETSTASAASASAPPETSTLVSIYRCDYELRVSEVIYSDHVGDTSKFIGGTDYEWLPQDEADGVMSLKQRALKEQRPVRDKIGRASCRERV